MNRSTLRENLKADMQLIINTMNEASLEMEDLYWLVRRVTWKAAWLAYERALKSNLDPFVQVGLHRMTKTEWAAERHARAGEVNRHDVYQGLKIILSPKEDSFKYSEARFLFKKALSDYRVSILERGKDVKNLLAQASSSFKEASKALPKPLQDDPGGFFLEKLGGATVMLSKILDDAVCCLERKALIEPECIEGFELLSSQIQYLKFQINAGVASECTVVRCLNRLFTPAFSLVGEEGLLCKIVKDNSFGEFHIIASD